VGGGGGEGYNLDVIPLWNSSVIVREGMWRGVGSGGKALIWLQYGIKGTILGDFFISGFIFMIQIQHLPWFTNTFLCMESWNDALPNVNKLN
jgi:hypothetical protein